MAPKQSAVEKNETDAGDEGAGERFLPDVEFEEEHRPECHNQIDGADFDAILSAVGEFGRYQWLLFIAMIPFALFFAFVLFVQMFVTATPKQYWCRVPELEAANLTTEHIRNLSIPPDAKAVGGYSHCTQYSVNWTALLETSSPQELVVDPAWPRAACRAGWHFLHEDIPYPTISTELGWVCERDSYATIAQAIFFLGSIVGGVLFGWMAGRYGRIPALLGWVCERDSYATIAQAIFFLGSIMGGVLFGWMADRYGRIPALVGCNVLGALGGVASVFATDLLSFSACRFIVGLAYDNCFMMMYIIVLEYVGAHYRTRVANMSIALFFGLGCVALPWVALWIADWRKLLLWTSVPMLIVITAPFLIPESVRWLLLQGRVDEATAIVRRIERMNKTQVPEKLLQDFQDSARLTAECRTEDSAAELLRRPLLRRMMLYLVLVYMACAVVFDALVRLSDALGLDFFLAFTLTSATEMPSVTLLALVLDRWGRRWLACVPMLLSGTACVVAAFVPSGVPSASLAIAARFFINMSYNGAIQWGAELLPTGARAGGSGLVHIMGYVATVLSPFIVYLEKLMPSLPLLVLAAVAAAGGLTSLLLPETMNRDLPQSFEDGERLMRSRTLFRARKKAKDVEMKEWSETQERD